MKEKIDLFRTRRHGGRFVCALKKEHFQLIQVQCQSFQELKNINDIRLTENVMTMSWQNFFLQFFKKSRNQCVCVDCHWSS